MTNASLPMYDWPEIREHTDAFWRGLAKHAGLAGSLDRTTNYVELWRNPHLDFSQTCGYPLTHEFKDIMSYVATPHYVCAGCNGATYSSFIFAREAKHLQEFRRKIAAINTLDSMSGMLALKLVFMPWVENGEFFERKIITGGHLNSLKAVREGKADICAIDAVCVALAQKYRPHELEGLTMIAQSPGVPGLPFVTRTCNPDQLRMALKKTFADPELKFAREALLMVGFSNLGAGAYDRITKLENNLPPFNL